jgi:benzoate/toluate 1,2-dioxygenase alpha subunit
MITLNNDALDELFDRRPDDGIYKVNRRVYNDPALYERELESIFEGSWIYVAHESQLPNKGDFVTVTMGRQPVIINRDMNGQINGFINACPHRGARLCRTERGNTKSFICTYHGWAFASDGEAKWIQREEEGYPELLDHKNDVGLKHVEKVESYRGFIFASLSADVPTLDQHLLGGKAYIDMLVDQAPNGLEVLKGSSSCVYKGNWKLMLENGGGDGLHPDYAHSSLLKVADRKLQRSTAVQTMQVSKMYEQVGGQWAFGNGHTGIWFNFPNPEDRPAYKHLAELSKAYGEDRAHWMTGVFRNLSIYPNLHLLDQMATLIRTFRPLDVNRTEITFFCIAPVGEPVEDRKNRLRQFEEFFAGSGMGTPDDNAEFEECQSGSEGRNLATSYISFGLHSRHEGTDEVASNLGIELSHSGIIGYEGCTMTQYDRWIELMTKEDKS